MSSIPFFLTIVTACLLCCDTTSWPSLHCFSSSILTASLLSISTSCLPTSIRCIVQFIIGEIVIIICLIDSYCQFLFVTPITPQILSNFLLSDTREIQEFLSLFINGKIISYWQIIVMLLLSLILPLSYLPLFNRYTSSASFNSKKFKKGGLILLIFCFVFEIPTTYRFSLLFYQQHNLQNIEGLIFRHYHEEVPTPLHRFAFSYFSVRESTNVLERIKRSSSNVEIDSCSHLSPHIVLIIGESYNKHHSSLYGYRKATTPFQQKRKENGELFVFTDVVTPWNITSNVFYDIFSIWEYGMQRKLDEYPMFPFLFRRAGYSVNFYSNQYLLRGFRKRVTNQAGHFFLADEEMSDSLFDYRNMKSFKYDLGLVAQVANNKNESYYTDFSLDIIHLIGQHFDYSKRYPHSQSKFTTKDYEEKNYSDEAKEIVMHYDNATYYNDLVLDSIINIYERENAIILFVADHGEEIYDDLPIHGRLFQKPTQSQAKQEFEVPLWIWCSNTYRRNHPNVIHAITESVNKPFMTDGIPQVLLSLAGISSLWEDDSRNLLSPHYRCKQRIIGGEVNYDEL